MILNDHLYLLPENTLRGPNVDEWGASFSRSFPPPCDTGLRQLAQKATAKFKLDEVTGGTYICIPGPNLKTPAETRHLQMIEADVVGMSLLPKILVAIHEGLMIEGDRIVKIGNETELSAKYPDADLLAEEHSLIMPGLVNTHTHAAMR